MTPLALLVLYFAAAHADNYTEIQCDTCVKIDSSCYNISFVVDLPANFRQHVTIHKMDVLHSVNTLFYVYEPPITDPEYYKVAYINLEAPIDTAKAGVIQEENEAHNFGTFAIDQDNAIVYLGGPKGIYTYKDNIVNIYSNYDLEILSLFFRNNLYIIRANETSIKIKVDSMFDTVLDVNDSLRNFAVHRDDWIVFSTRQGLFFSKKGHPFIKLSNNAYFRGLAVDLQGEVYAWWVDGIYKVEIKERLAKSTIRKIADLPNIGAMTFDNDNNILFNNDRALYKATLLGKDGIIC